MIDLTLPFPPSVNSETPLCESLADLPAEPGIYMIRDGKSGRFYVGSAAGVRQRARQHEYRLRKGSHANRQMQSIWNSCKKRLSISVIRIMPGAPISERLREEQKYLDAAQVGKNRDCINVLPIAGSGAGAKRDADFCRRMSEINKGREFSEEARQRMREAKIGRALSADHRKTLSRARKGKPVNRPEGIINKKVRALSDDDVRRLRSMRKEGFSWRELGLEFGMNISACRRAAIGETYRDVE